MFVLLNAKLFLVPGLTLLTKQFYLHHTYERYDTPGSFSPCWPVQKESDAEKMHRNHKFNEHRNVEFPSKNSSSKEMLANFPFRLDKNQKVFHLLIMIFAITAFVGGKNFPSASVPY